MADRFAGKVVLITGASSGIGEALAREFAKQGAAIALLARRADRLDALAAELRTAGRRALAVPCDVTRDGDLEAAVARVTSEFGRVDVAVANAGFGVAGQLADLSLDDYRRQFETNVFGVLRTVYATFDPLTRTGGALVLIGSVSGHVAAPSASAYSMSKFAVRALAGAIRGELAPRGVGVVLISPGFVHSEISRVDNLGRFHPEAKEPSHRRFEMPAEMAARQIVRAVSRRQRERVITAHGKLAVMLARHTPRLVAWLLDRSRWSRSEPGHDGHTIRAGRN
ncbi:MAG: SDR family NAD(P)-dependent oxidoreductase [Thermoanaerobaculaceae bacterium]|jgi:short-subunit dehydrogenase